MLSSSRWVQQTWLEFSHVVAQKTARPHHNEAREKTQHVILQAADSADLENERSGQRGEPASPHSGGISSNLAKLISHVNAQLVSLGHRSVVKLFVCLPIKIFGASRRAKYFFRIVTAHSPSFQIGSFVLSPAGSISTAITQFRPLFLAL